MHQYSRWQDALVEQTRLYEFSLSPMGQEYLGHIFESMNSQHEENKARSVQDLYSLCVDPLVNGEPIYVSDESCELIQHARETFTAEAVQPYDAFTPKGFALLAKPLLLRDGPVTDENPYRSPVGEIPIRAIAWTSLVSDEDPNVGCFWIGYYVSVQDEIAMAEEAGIPSVWDDGTAVEMRRHMPLSLVHQFQWTFGEEPWRDEVEITVPPGDDPAEVAERGLHQVTLIQTFWRIASQFTIGKQQAPRGIWRDAKRKGVDKRDVVVVTLRRLRPDGGFERDGEHHLTHQFVVRGYWARRHYRDGITRQVWVRPHVKGPKDAEFVFRDRVWEFSR